MKIVTFRGRNCYVGYDVAQICITGHVVNDAARASPEHNQKFCIRCGAETMEVCRGCNAPIRGRYHNVRVLMLTTPAPIFCHECGKPYPWTECRLRDADELADIVEGLEDAERNSLKSCFPDLIRDTPKATAAAVTMTKLCKKSGEVAVLGFKQIFVDVVSKTAATVLKQGLGW